MELKMEHISKKFKDKTAVDDVSLTLTTGVWGLLGANGAGKTTLMRMIADIMTQSSGNIYTAFHKTVSACSRTALCISYDCKSPVRGH